MSEIPGLVAYHALVSTPNADGARRPRRSPAADARQRDAERSRERILAAAGDEFAERGFAGARVASIAARAGVNAQLISYYFGGKRGLFDAIKEQWVRQEAVIADPSRPYGEVLAGYFNAGYDDQRGARMLLWQALEFWAGSERPGELDQSILDALGDIRRRQEAGELTNDYDAEFILVVSQAATMVPLILPQVVRDAFGTDPRSAEFRERFLAQVQRLFLPDSDEAS